LALHGNDKVFECPTLLQSTIHTYEVRPRRDHRGADLISDVLPFGRLRLPFQRIAPESFLIAGWRMIRLQPIRKAHMKTILMLTVGLMLAGCGSTGSHVRNHGVSSPSRITLPDRGNGIAVETICACP
jgi:hypothetical protein